MSKVDKDVLEGVSLVQKEAQFMVDSGDHATADSARRTSILATAILQLAELVGKVDKPAPVPKPKDEPKPKAEPAKKA